MDNKLEIEKINLSDRAVRVISEDGLFRAVAVKNSTLARTAQENHQYPAEVSLPHSNLLTYANLMASFLKGEERVLVDLQNFANVGKLYAEAMTIGEIRGFASDYSHDDKKILKISRILYGETEPITGIIEFNTDNIEDIFEEYLRMSEQIPSFVRLDATVDSNGFIDQSGGMLVQAMPGASEADIEQVQNAVRNAKPFSDFLSQGLRPDQILKEILPFNFNVIKSTRLDFFCRCNKELFLSKLMTLGADEITSMQADKHNELVCQFCNKKYILDDKDFNQLIIDIQAKNN